MAFAEPGRGEVLMTRYLLGTIGRLWYGKYFNGLELNGGERVIDYGSGAGIGAAYVARKLGKGGRLTCVDISRAWLDEARRRLRGYSNVDFRLGDICCPGLPDGAYDAAIVSFVLHDMGEEERPRKLGCLAKKLKAGGKIFIREPVSLISRREIRKLMADAGMEEAGSADGRVPTMGPTFEATYVRR